MGSVPRTFEQQPVIAKMQEQQTNGQPEKSELYQNLLPKKTIKGLSAFTLTSGILSILIQIGSIVVSYTNTRYPRIWEYQQWNIQIPMAYVGQGIWCGLFSVLTGALGISTAKKPSLCKIIALMVLSILSAVMSFPHMWLDAMGIDQSSTPRSCAASDSCHVLMALFSLNFILALAAGITSIVISAYTCKAVCCCGYPMLPNPIQMSKINMTKATSNDSNS